MVQCSVFVISSVTNNSVLISCDFSFQKKVADTILKNGLNNRYRVLEVSVIQRNGSDPEKHLTITASPSLEETELCILRNGW